MTETLAAPSPDRTDPPSYRADIDGLRAVAVLAVLGYHAFPERIPGGFVGVDVFFVISGFLITGILLASLDRGTFTLRGFYARRVRRIFPALIVVLAACWIFGWFALFPDEYRQLGRHIVGGSAFVSNVYFWREAGYFDNAAETKPLLHLWSLGIEEQFYIVWPLLLYWTRRARLRVLYWLPALAIVSFVVNVAWVERYPTATFYSPASRAWELALGGLLAYLTRRQVDVASRIGERVRRLLGRSANAEPGTERDAVIRALLSATGLLLLALPLALLAEGDPFPGWWAVPPTLGTALIVAGGARSVVNRMLLANRPIVWIGLISYPLYLWHWPLLSFARVVESETPALEIRVAALAASFVLATATYWLLERPFRFGERQRKVATLAVAMTIVWAAGRVTASNHGLPWRSTIQAQLAHQRALVLPDDAAQAAQCSARYGFDESFEFCLLDRPDSPPTVALVGDSHAYHLVAGLTRYFHDHGENLLYLGTRIPFWDIVLKDDDYQSVTNEMLDIALGAPTVHTVLITSALKLDDRSSQSRQFVEAMEKTVGRYLGVGKRVIWIEDVPELDFDPRQCIRRAAIPARTTRWPCATRRALFDEKTARHDEVLARLQRRVPAMQILETAKHLCDTEVCWAMRDDHLLYRDKDHLSRDGDLWLAARYAPDLDALVRRTE